MNRSSKYHALKYIVECKPDGRYSFETIAAFNNDVTAKHYANDCANVNRKNEYRVMERKSRGYVQIYDPRP